jgi:hypothetical protein
MKKILAATLLALAATPALAIQVEFQVPVELKNIEPDAVSFDVICGSFGNNSYLNSVKVTVPFRDAKTHKYYSGTVAVKVNWPGTSVPTGSYRCAIALKTKTDYMDFERRPAAVGTRAVTKVDGTFQELRGLPQPQMKQSPTKPAVKQQIQR